MFFNRENVKKMRESYPQGTRIVCDYSADTYHPLKSGLVGTINFVDDMGTIHVNWDNGRTLGLIPGEDSFHLLEVE